MDLVSRHEVASSAYSENVSVMTHLFEACNREFSLGIGFYNDGNDICPVGSGDVATEGSFPRPSEPGHGSDNESDHDSGRPDVTSTIANFFQELTPDSAVDLAGKMADGIWRGSGGTEEYASLLCSETDYMDYMADAERGCKDYFESKDSLLSFCAGLLQDGSGICREQPIFTVSSDPTSCALRAAGNFNNTLFTRRDAVYDFDDMQIAIEGCSMLRAYIQASGEIASGSAMPPSSGGEPDHRPDNETGSDGEDCFRNQKWCDELVTPTLNAASNECSPGGFDGTCGSVGCNATQAYNFLSFVYKNTKECKDHTKSLGGEDGILSMLAGCAGIEHKLPSNPGGFPDGFPGDWAGGFPGGFPGDFGGPNGSPGSDGEGPDGGFPGDFGGPTGSPGSDGEGPDGGFPGDFGGFPGDFGGPNGPGSGSEGSGSEGSFVPERCSAQE